MFAPTPFLEVDPRILLPQMSPVTFPTRPGIYYVNREAPENTEERYIDITEIISSDDGWEYRRLYDRRSGALRRTEIPTWARSWKHE